LDDEVDAVRRTVDEGVECTRPDLRVRGELERRAADCEEERLEVGVLLRRDAEQARVRVENGASCVRVTVVRVASHKDEGCACVNDPGGGLENRSRIAVTNGLVDAPVPARRKSLDKRSERDVSGEF